MFWGILPPGLRGLRTPLIIGGSIAWDNTAPIGLLEEVFHCDLWIPPMDCEAFNMARQLSCKVGVKLSIGINRVPR